MKRKDFIRRFDLVNTGQKVLFHNGGKIEERTLYIRSVAEVKMYYVFFGGDLHTIDNLQHGTFSGYTGHLGAGYSWYH